MLPKIDVPIYETKLISTGKKIKFRPFTVKEEKLFLMAQETDDVETAINTVYQVINNCVLDKIDVTTLPVFDIENLFLNLRAKSVGEVVNLKYKCNNDVPKEEGEGTHKCGNVVEIDFNVLDVELPTLKKDANNIKLTDKLGISMKYPSFNIIQKYEGKSDAETLLDIIIECVDFIYDEDNVYYAKDASKEELIDFFESLQAKDLEKVKVFFDDMPKLTKKLEFKCKKCGYHEEIELEGIQSFFA